MATVLLADADDERIAVVRKLVRREGHRTVVARDGNATLERAINSHPAVVIADTALPGLDGYGLALQIREEVDADTVRIILVKESVADEDRTTARAVGADELVPRSLLGEEGLMDVLRTTLATRVPEDGAVSGEIDEEALFGILQFLHQRRVTGTLSVAGPTIGTIVFAGGEIIGARTASKTGADAFVGLLSSQSGRYCFDSGLVDPASRSIERAFDPLMMDAFATLND